MLDGSFGTRGPLPGPNFMIGANYGRQVGTNLFQSFSQFNLNSSQSATFTGSANVHNILARVTGGSASSIDGTIHSDIAGANLFFMNPAGVLFGQHAQLDVSGSFAVTTSNYLNLVGGGRFNANLGGGDVLTSAPVSAFGFLNSAPAAVSFTGSNTTRDSVGNIVPRPGLGIAPQKSFSVVAGDIAMKASTISGERSRVNLVSVKSPGEVQLDATNVNSAVDVTQFTAMGTINLTNLALIDTSGPSGGPVVIRGGNLYLDNSQILSQTTGSIQGGAIDIAVTESMRITSLGQISSSTVGIGNAGSVNVTADSLLIDGTGFFLTGIFAGPNVENGSSGNGGSIAVHAGDLRIMAGGVISSSTQGAGNAGSVNVTADSLLIDGKEAEGNAFFGTGVFALAAGEIGKNGNGGSIAVHAGDLRIMPGGAISSSTLGAGNAGSVNVTADSLLIDGTGDFPTGIFALSDAEFNFAGKGGSIAVNAGDLRIIAGGVISSGTETLGDSGSVNVTADSLLIDGARASPHFGTGIFVDGNAGGIGGSIVVLARSLQILAGGQISSSVHNGGSAGSVNVTADSLLIDGTGAPISSVGIFGGTGIFGEASGFDGLRASGGSLFVQAGDLSLTAGGQITASLLGGRGQGGDLNIHAGSLSIDGSTAPGVFTGLSASTQGTGNAGNISLAVDNTLSLFGGGQISAASSTSGAAGSLQLRLGTLSINSGSSISSANADSGEGGSVMIATTGPVRLRQGSSISASSALGDAGSIDIVSGGEIKLKDQSSITASAGVNGGDITITAPGQLVYLVDSSITATAGSTGSSGTGGNITIDHPQFIVASNSLISANATVGTAGNVYLNSDFLFTSNSQIFATGTVNITAPSLDLGAELITLPTSLLSAESQLQERCTALLRGDFSSFISIGRGGTEPPPEELQTTF